MNIKHLFIFFIFLLNSCIGNLRSETMLTAKSLNEYWKIYYYNPSILYEKSFSIYVFSEELKDIRIKIYTYSTDYELQDCPSLFIIEFLKVIKKKNQEIKNINLELDKNKIFFIKNNKNNYLKFYGSTLPEIIKNNKIVISKNLINEKNKNIIFDFKSPIGCQALEGTTLVIGGIYLNGEELPPIEIELSYKKDKK